MEVDYIDYDDYVSVNETENISKVGVIKHLGSSESSLTNVLVAVNIITSIVGIGGNSVVIWICGWKMKKTVITTWYISLAISNILFCAFLPLDVFYMMTSHWPFGQALCKFTSSILFLNMHSNVFLLVLISADRCVLISFPVWAHNHRTVKKAFGVVALMWILSALQMLPSLIFRNTKVQGSVTQCYTDYGDDYKRTQLHNVVILSRFICGFLIPFVIIVFCCVVLSVKLKSSTIRSKKPYKIIVALILSFFICWVPYHTFVLLELDFRNQNLVVIETGQKVGVTLAAANSFISPILYVFIGNDFKQTLKRSLTSRFEEAMAEDFRTGGLSASMSKSMDTIRNEHTLNTH